MKQVVFNALQTSLSGGIGRYSYELAKEMYKLDRIDLKIVIREEDKNLFDFAKQDDLIIAKGIKDSKSRNYYEQLKLPKLIHELYPKAIIHYPDSMAPLLAKNKVIITIHDLAFKSLKNAFTWKTVLWKSFMTKLSIKKAYKIIAITNFARDEVLKHYNIETDKVDVVYNGFNDFSKEQIEYKNISKKILNLKNKEYILTVSTISPRKNIDGLIKAFNMIKNKVNCNLIIAGKNGWMYEDIFKLVETLDLKNKIFFTGSINDDELKFLYKNSKLFVYPSLYEGFGLPPLEAMSYGIPCIVSNRTCIPEVVGDAAIKVNPEDLYEVGNIIVEILKNKEMSSDLLSKANDRLKYFSWKKCSNGVVNIYLVKNKI